MDAPPQSVLFCCDHNAVRSPMAEGLMKKLHGTATYVQSAGLRADLEIDGFAIAVCREIGVELSRHRSRSLDDMGRRGDDPGAFDIVVALSEASWRRALELARSLSLEVERWPIPDPTGIGGTREARLAGYRRARDRIAERLAARWGAPGDG